MDTATLINTTAPTTHEDALLLDDDAADALAGRLVESMVPGLELLTVEFGRRLGLYEALALGGAVTARELAERAGIHPRVAREWLEQQATAGFIAVGVSSDDPDLRRFMLPEAYIPVLLDEESPAYALGAATMFAGTASAFEDVLEASRTGSGVSYGAFGAGVRHGLQQLNRPGYVNDLAAWVVELPDVLERLAHGGRILDLGSGTGWSSIALARAFPNAEVIGIELDGASVAEARTLAAEQDLSSRVRFVRADATVQADVVSHAGGEFDLVTIFEALHDMNEPEAALRVARSLLAPSGSVLIGDEKVADEFTPGGDFLERLNYGFSLLHCLPATMAEGEGTANGTVLRQDTVRTWAIEAGFSATMVLPIEHPFWRFYRLDA